MNDVAYIRSDSPVYLIMLQGTSDDKFSIENSCGMTYMNVTALAAAFRFIVVHTWYDSKHDSYLLCYHMSYGLIKEFLLAHEHQILSHSKLLHFYRLVVGGYPISLNRLVFFPSHCLHQLLQLFFSFIYLVIYFIINLKSQ